MAKTQPFSLEATYVPVSTRASSRSKKPLHIGTVIPNLLLMIVSIPERSWRLETKRCAGRLRSGR